MQVGVETVILLQDLVRVANRMLKGRSFIQHTASTLPVEGAAVCFQPRCPTAHA
jgi:hypothetical protein